MGFFSSPRVAQLESQLLALQNDNLNLRGQIKDLQYMLKESQDRFSGFQALRQEYSHLEREYLTSLSTNDLLSRDNTNYFNHLVTFASSLMSFYSMRSFKKCDEFYSKISEASFFLLRSFHNITSSLYVHNIDIARHHYNYEYSSIMESLDELRTLVNDYSAYVDSIHNDPIMSDISLRPLFESIEGDVREFLTNDKESFDKIKKGYCLPSILRDRYEFVYMNVSISIKEMEGYHSKLRDSLRLDITDNCNPVIKRPSLKHRVKGYLPRKGIWSTYKK